jgi:EmrB/QacA subfamily drug resistance transporter
MAVLMERTFNIHEVDLDDLNVVLQDVTVSIRPMEVPVSAPALSLIDPATRDPRRWWILLVLIVALFGVSVDNTILIIALPTLARDLQATAADLQWMVDAYILVFAGFLLLSGALADRYGRRLMLVLGLILFGVGSLFAPFVTSADQLIALRAFMGLGASFMMPSTLSIIADVFDSEERPKAIAAWGSISAIGIVAGPLLGGWLLDNFDWPSVFLINVPFAIIGVIATMAVVPESRAPNRVSLDIVGAVLSVVGLVSLVYAIIEIPARGWDDPSVIVASVVAIVTLAAFIVWERRTPAPMLDIGLFRDQGFAAACLSVTLVFFALNGALFFLTQYMQGVQGLDAFATGLRFIPVAIGVMLGAGISANAVRRLGARVVTSAGLALMAVGLLGFALITVDSGDVFIGVLLFVCSAGIGLAMTPATDAIMGALPPDQFGVGSAVNDTTREIGGALGIAILGSLFAASYSGRLTPQVPASVPADVAHIITESLAGAMAVAEQVGGAAGAALVTAAQEAFVGAMSLTTIAGSIIAFAGVLVAVLWMPDRPSDHARLVAASGSAGVGEPVVLTGDREQGEQRRQHGGADAQPDGALQ